VSSPPSATGTAGLLARARQAATAAHAPYSKFRVGAAVRAGGVVYTGCNVENASYGLSICAERVAIFTAIAAGATRIDALAVACIDAAPDATPGSVMPCGACRQVMAEFGTADVPVQVDRAGTFTVAQLLPQAFALPRF
jgi:cytidine deaminase